MKKTLVRARYALLRVRAEGFLWATKKVYQVGIYFFFVVLFLPVGFVGHICGYRRLPVITSRIGHLAGEVDCFLKLLELGEFKKNRKYFLLAPPGKVANAFLVDLWAKHITVIRAGLICRFLEYSSGLLMRVDISEFILGLHGPARYGKVNVNWQGRDPIIALSEAQIEKGNAILQEMGIDKERWIVCFHVREKGYSPEDDRIQDYRNSSIEKLVPALRSLVLKGAVCFRMGDTSMKKFDPMPGVVDYAHSVWRSDFMDVFLCSQARFFLGNTSGIFILSTIFSVPCALANMVPFSVRGFHPRDINIYKIMQNKLNCRPVTLTQAKNLRIFSTRASNAFSEAGVVLLENDEEDIESVVAEMLDRINCDGAFIYHVPELVKSFNSFLSADDYGYESQSSLGQRFLQKYGVSLGLSDGA